MKVVINYRLHLKTYKTSHNQKVALIDSSPFGNKNELSWAGRNATDTLPTGICWYKGPDWHLGSRHRLLLVHSFYGALRPTWELLKSTWFFSLNEFLQEYFFLKQKSFNKDRFRPNFAKARRRSSRSCRRRRSLSSLSTPLPTMTSLDLLSTKEVRGLWRCFDADAAAAVVGLWGQHGCSRRSRPGRGWPRRSWCRGRAGWPTPDVWNARSKRRAREGTEQPGNKIKIMVLKKPSWKDK